MAENPEKTPQEPERVGTGEPERVGDSEEKAKAARRAEKAFTRRQMFAGTAIGIVAGALAGAGIDHGVERAQNPEIHSITDVTNMIDLGLTTPFYDQEHPSGIRCSSTPRYATFLEFEMNETASAQDLQVLLATWSAAASLLMQGKPLGKVRPDFKTDSVPKDTGETTDLYPANLSIVFGFGPKLFDDRFGLAKFKPKNFSELPRITDDRFEASKAGSDLGIWMKADDYQVMFHAVRALARLAGSKASLTLSNTGYLSARQHGKPGTARAAHGFHVGLTGVSTDRQFDDYVWISESDQDWLVGGTYMVYRDTFFDILPWDIDRISDQEQTIGRRKDTGAPLSNPDGDYSTPPDFDAKDEDGNYLIDPRAHIHLVSEEYLGFKVLSDGYRYWHGLMDNGKQDAGFVNVFFQNDLDHFTKMRDALGKYDLVKEYYYDTASGTYAVPQSPKTGRYVGQEFFE